MVPSDRVIVPNWLAGTLPEAEADPVVVNGGQAEAHWPEQLDIELVSGVYRYSARPDWSVRKVPRAPLFAWTVTSELGALAIPLDDEPPLAGAELLVLVPLLQAATSAATAASGAPKPTAEGTFRPERILLMYVSSSRRDVLSHAFFLTCTL